MPKRTKAKYDTFFTPYPVVRCAFVVLLFLWINNDVQAQFKIYPTQRKAITTASQSNLHKQARVQADEPLSLPFFDDFSFTPVDNYRDTIANYPLDSIWVDDRKTWIGSGIGINPPSINVATFDGLDSIGRSYSDIQLQSGLCDQLVSRPIDLSEPAVAASERTSVWISFHYQWCGNGEPPDASDFFRLSFLTDKGKWITVWTMSSEEQALDRTVFYDTIIQVHDNNATETFFHSGFQFKFENRGRKTGPFDTWNLDYIYLDKGRTINSNSFPDRAMADPLANLYGDYYAMPLRHVLPDLELDTPAFAFKNMKSAAVLSTFNYKAYLEVKNYKDGTATVVNTILAEMPTTANILPGPLERVVQPLHFLPDLNDPSLYHMDADSIFSTIQIEIGSGDEIDPDKPGFLPIDFTINDTSSVTYTLKDYYAYDDGIAEYAAGNIASGNQLAYAFDMLTPDADTLVGFYAYFPPFSLTPSRLIDIQIYMDENGFPRATPYYTLENYSVPTKRINEFHFVRIVEPITVKDRFYIGFQSGNVQVGWDTSNGTGDRIFQRVNKYSPWTQPQFANGSMMIRPVFGKGNGGGPITGIPEETLVSLYPNPSEGQFFIKGHATLLEAYTITGASVSFTTENFGDDTHKITLHNPTAGLYILKLKSKNQIVTEKIIVR